MVARELPVVVGGAAAFVTAVTIGAFVIVSLSPDERRPTSETQQSLLMEGMTVTKPFEAAVPSAPPSRQSRPSAQTMVLAPDTRRSEPAPLAESEPAIKSATLSPGDRVDAPVGGPTKEFVRPGALQIHRPDPKSLPRPSIHPPQAAPPAQTAPLTAQPRADGLLTLVEIRRMRMALRLTREQEPYWIPVEQALLEISAQQTAMVRAGQDPKDAFGIGTGMRVYSAARPLLEQLREDQKALVRARARAMGFGSIASSL
ncbi:hypothetical protein QO001_005522 [Methylobacterium brachiatum]|uniref:Uncharacterized protein n=1 Tax=Methylobacterium brachiatum TaxID=269660 RepID=A0AAJ1WZS3_9HYPH|nr:hypothetical protein [Methylobacterium brachiatum]MCB4805518.1 hypothetical protein [Methylobacterium brachiatum]MDQ0546570.1 hypothetical protein [Methylobacterium brachiatum]